MITDSELEQAFADLLSQLAIFVKVEKKILFN
jgi:hypothetical protein